MTDPYPIRIWRQDKNLNAKLDAFRNYLREGKKKFGGPVNGVQVYEMPVNIDKELVNSFTDLQGLLYSQQISTNFLSYFLRYWDEYRQMFTFDPNLAHSLYNTDVADVPWSEIRLPHSDFHVSWGDFGQESFWIADLEYVIDGAFVRHVPTDSTLFPNDTLLLTFTSQLVYPSYKKAKESRSAKGFHFSEPIYDYAISGAGVETVGQAIENGEKEYLDYCSHLDDQLFDSAHAWAPEAEVIPIGKRIYPFRDKFGRGINSIKGSIPLLFNTLFYLTQRPENRINRYPDSAPRGQVKKLHSESNKKVCSTIRDSLARKGYSEVTFIHDSEVSAPENTSPSDRNVRSHWRRGHWRNQPCGKSMAHRKWIWIKPVLVKREEQFQVGTKHTVKDENTEE